MNIEKPEMATIENPAKPKPTVFGIKIGSSNIFRGYKFQPCSSWNNREINIKKLKMATIGEPAKPNLLRLVSKFITVIGVGVFTLNSKFEPCSFFKQLR